MDVAAGTAGEVECEDSLEDFHRLCGCETIDIVMRFIEGKVFCFIVDDEGLLRDPDSIRISALGSDGEAALVGNLLVLAPDEDRHGELRSLTETELDVLRRHTGRYIIRDLRGRDYNTVAVDGLSHRPSMSVVSEARDGQE